MSTSFQSFAPKVWLSGQINPPKASQPCRAAPQVMLALWCPSSAIATPASPVVPTTFASPATMPGRAVQAKTFVFQNGCFGAGKREWL